VAGVDAEEGQLADERVGHDLEDQSREGLGVRRLALDERLVIGIDPLDRRDVHGDGR